MLTATTRKCTITIDITQVMKSQRRDRQRNVEEQSDTETRMHRNEHCMLNEEQIIIIILYYSMKFIFKDIETPLGWKALTSFIVSLWQSRSAFFYFCQELRGKMRELHPEMGVGDIAKELGKLWMSTDLQTKSKYMAIAEEDRARYERVRLYWNLTIV